MFLFFAVGGAEKRGERKYYTFENNDTIGKHIHFEEIEIFVFHTKHTFDSYWTFFIFIVENKLFLYFSF